MVNPRDMFLFPAQSAAMPADRREAAPAVGSSAAAATCALGDVSVPLLGSSSSLMMRRSPPVPAPAPLPDLLPLTDSFAYYHTLLARKDGGFSEMESVPAPDEQPLDLSCSRPQPPPATSRSARRCEPPAPPPKKPYTEEELQAALRDIQSGRLGTRRAAVIYGIPRSTLRNKVYRLAAQEKRAEAERPVKLAAASPPPPPPSLQHPPESMPETLLPEPLLERSAAASEATEAPSVDHSAACQLLLARLTRPVEPAAEPIRAVMSWMYSGVLQRALQARETAAPRPDAQPVWDDFVRRMTHERFHEVLAQLRAAGAGRAADTPTPPTAAVPTWASSAELSDSNAGSDSPCSPGGSAGRKRKLENESPGPEAGVPETNNNNTLPAKSGTTGKPTKGSRPKRGKYRNYKRSHLADAVRAVQSGEMSVHRAGNFYGVPHSTLEYKVKQRHLDRPSKRDRERELTEARRPASSPTPADRVATSGGVLTYVADSPPAAGPLMSGEVLRQLQLGADPGQLLANELSISNRAHNAGGQLLQTSQDF